MRLADGDNGHAVMTYEADANVTGPLAGVGQRLMGAAARRTTEQFLEALDRYIEAPEAATAPAAARSRAPRSCRPRSPRRPAPRSSSRARSAASRSP